jgi:glycosyltransferase involved in cell wall biosynthesis
LSKEKPVITVVIPCYKVKGKVLDVLARIPPEVAHIICVDDACPEQSGAFIKQSCGDRRVQVLFHEKNQGVGGAMVTGYKSALTTGADIIVKVDGDGQMAPELIPSFTAPILKGTCDYTKGNRFFRPEDLHGMPGLRIFGNGILSFLTKLSGGYWDIFDPTNGYTAIHAKVLRQMPLEKLDHSYFHESDMLFRLNILRAVVRDIPMSAVYDGEESSLSIRRILWPFLKGHARNLSKRIVYNYFLRDFHIASLELLLGIVFLLFGVVFGLVKWSLGQETGIPASAGTVMLGALPVILGFQMLLSFLQFDIQSVPRAPLHQSLPD